MAELKIDLTARDARFTRAAQDVLKRYRLTRHAGSAPIRVDVVGGQAPYVVTVDPDWASPPACTCPDRAERTGGYCKHIVAVLLANDDVRCQLLPLYL